MKMNVSRVSDEMVTKWQDKVECAEMIEELRAALPEQMALNYGVQYGRGLITLEELTKVIAHKALVRREWERRGWATR